MSACLVTIRGIPHIPDIVTVNVRTGPGTNFDKVQEIAVGIDKLAVLDVQPDSESNNKDGKVYQWFKVTLPDHAEGWLRDDLIFIVGDGTAWGYPNLNESGFAFDYTRSETTPDTPATQPTDQPIPVTEPVSPVALDAERVKKASFAITAAFEGGSYKAYNNYDAGIVSYGLFQFTLAASSLQAVLERYIAASESNTSKEMEKYMPRVVAKDGTLRYDMGFKSVLLAAGDEPEMQQAQIGIGTEKYWDAVYYGYVEHRGLKTPLGWALLFDMGINFGTGHAFVRIAEDELGVPRRSRPGENGVTEEQLIAKVAELRKRSHDRQAARDNLPGLRVRGDFWVNLITQGDWGLQGDVNGFVNVNGRLVQVKNPA